MLNKVWCKYRALQFQEGYYIFNTKTRAFVKVNKIGYTIQSYFEKYKHDKEVLQQLELSFENFDYRSAIMEIKDFYTNLSNETISKTANHSNSFAIGNDFNSLSWVISSKCNLKCKHCRQLSLKELSFENKKKLIDSIAQQTLIQKVTLTGGEPTIHPEIWDLIDYLKQYGFDLSIITNGTKIEKKLLKNVILHDIALTISLDGTHNYHNAIRGDGVFEKTYEGLKRLEENQIPFSINKVIISDYEDDEALYIRMLEPFTFLRKINIFRCIPTGQAIQNIRFEKNLHYSILKKLINAFSESSLKERVKLFVDDPIAPIYIQKESYQNINILFGCLARNGTLSIQPDGSILPCQALPIKIDIWNEEFNWNLLKNNSIIKKFLKRDKDKKIFTEDCINCSEFLHCYGGCGAFSFSTIKNFEQVSLIKKDPYCPK